MRLRLWMLGVHNLLAHVLGEDLVEDVVGGQAEAVLVDEELLHQEGVQVVGVHHVVPGHVKMIDQDVATRRQNFAATTTKKNNLLL